MALRLRIDHVKIILVLTLSYIISAPLIPFARDRAVWVTLVFVVLVGAIAAFYKATVDVAIAAVIAVALLIARFIFPNTIQSTLLLRTAAILAFLFLHFTLLIGPWSRFTRHFLHFYKHRRHVGVTTFLLALLHASFVMNIYFQYSYESAYQAVFVFFGSTALFILAILALTSWDSLQKHVRSRTWSIVYGVAFIMYLLFVAYFLMVFEGELTAWQTFLILAFLAFWLLVAPWSLSRRVLVVVNGWKQLHVLIYIVYASVIAHVWTGTAKNQDPWVQALFWTLVLGVVGSHATGWIIMLKQFLERRRRRAESILLNGKKYYQLDTLSSFVPGQGRRFDIEGVPIAVFFHEGKIIAFSNFCSHQKGPIFQGEIAHGYVECPWHRYQFSVEDGSGPPGFEDCIPYYPVIMRGSMAYVCLEPLRPVRLFV